MILRVIRWAVENVIEVQEHELPSDTKLVVFETMSDVRVRVLKEYETAPLVYEEPKT